MLMTQMTDFTNDIFESIKWQMQKADTETKVTSCYSWTKTKTIDPNFRHCINVKALVHIDYKIAQFLINRFYELVISIN
jgi:hypothetical protein